MRPEVKQLLYDLPNTSSGQALKEFLTEEYIKLDSVEGITDMAEVKGKQLALATLEKIFSFYKKDKIDSPKTKYV